MLPIKEDKNMMKRIIAEQESSGFRFTLLTSYSLIAYAISIMRTAWYAKNGIVTYLASFM